MTAEKTTYQYTAGQREVIDQLTRIQADTGLSDTKFAVEHLTVHGTTWTRIREGTYAADPTSALLKLESNLRMLRIERAQGNKLTGTRAFHRLTHQQAAIEAITGAKLKPAQDPDRLVVYLAETGGGKSELGRQLKVMYDGILVEARESWRDSYFAALCDIGLAAGVGEDDLGPSKHDAETALLKRLRANRRVLVIDEGEYFGPRTINLVKLILNQTETVVVILAIPALFSRWTTRSWEESKQLIRRAHAVIDAGLVIPADVATFLHGHCTIAAGEQQKVCNLIAGAANEFGRYDLIARVAADLADEGSDPITEEAAKQAVRNIKRLLNRA